MASISAPGTRTLRTLRLQPKVTTRASIRERGGVSSIDTTSSSRQEQAASRTAPRTTVAGPQDPASQTATLPVVVGVATAVVSAAVGAVAFAFQTSVMALLYMDLRMRNDGLDIALLRLVETGNDDGGIPGRGVPVYSSARNSGPSQPWAHHQGPYRQGPYQPGLGQPGPRHEGPYGNSAGWPPPPGPPTMPG